MLTEFLKNSKDEIQAYYCGKCGYIYKNKDSADSCCKCIICGEYKNHQYTNRDCEPCREKRYIERELKQLEDAEDVTATYDGPVFYGGDYYESIGDLLEHLEDNIDEDDKSLPGWAFACTIDKLSEKCASYLTEHFIETILDDQHEDAREQIGHVEPLKQAIKEFLSKQTVESWNVDYTKKINIDDKIQALSEATYHVNKAEEEHNEHKRD